MASYSFRAAWMRDFVLPHLNELYKPWVLELMKISWWKGAVKNKKY